MKWHFFDSTLINIKRTDCALNDVKGDEFTHARNGHHRRDVVKFNFHHIACTH